MGVHKLAERPRAAEVPGDRGLVPADEIEALRRPGDHKPGSGRRPCQGKAAQNARPRPVSPYYSDMSLEMAEQFHASLNGEESPEQAARTLQTPLEQMIEEGQES